MEGQTTSMTLEISVVIPCLNEVETLPSCLDRVRHVFKTNSLSGEVIVADNGSTDGSSDVAAKMGAKLLHVDSRGYGNAVSAGIAAARGRYIVVGDAEGSYDFLEVPRFIAKLREGF